MYARLKNILMVGKTNTPFPKDTHVRVLIQQLVIITIEQFIFTTDAMDRLQTSLVHVFQFFQMEMLVVLE